MAGSVSSVSDAAQQTVIDQLGACHSFLCVCVCLCTYVCVYILCVCVYNPAGASKHKVYTHTHTLKQPISTHTH